MIKTSDQIKNIRVAGKILASVAKKVKAAAHEGVTLKELDALTRKLIEEAGAESTFLGYQPYGADVPFPASVCTSVNDVVVHGIPTGYRLQSGDILSLDFGVTYNGFIADGAFTMGIGKLTKEARELIETTHHALALGIKECKPGKTLGDIGWAISHYVTERGFKVVKGLTGHGVGIELHEDPPVFNEGQKNTGMALKPGMVLALEPMVSAGDPYIRQLSDDSYATRDKSLSAHFEHTVLITEKGHEILTQ
ncbi:MAG: type I methionyl aminopeptidase [Patescibacteria group bacterium]|nr:type I methionyl aminopeptidase [Patescibacteria group bacterium]